MSTTKTHTRFAKSLHRSLTLILVFVMVISVGFIAKTHAATLNDASIVELAGSGSPMIAAAGNELAIAFEPATAGVPSSISLAFGSSWTSASGSVLSGTITTSATSCTTYFPTATELAAPTATGSGSTITMSTTTNLSTSTLYCTELTSGATVTNPTAGAYQPVLNSGSDSSTEALDILSTGANAYSITATTLPTFTMSLSSTTDTFTTPNTYLSPSAVTTSNGITAQVSTNAISGWFLWAEDANSGLASAATGHTIPSVTSCTSNSTLTSGSENYALGVTVDNTPNYAYTSSTHGGCLNNATYYEIATNGAPANAVQTVLHELATISNTTPAAPDYTDTITVIGAGSF